MQVQRFEDNYRGFNSITYMMGMEGVANRLTDKSLGATYLDYTLCLIQLLLLLLLTMVATLN